MRNEAWNIDEKEYPTRGVFIDKAKFILRYAVLAPSGHNSQPWKFEILKNKIIIHPDYNRGRSVVDSEHRELFISVGAVSKIIAICADNFGFSHERRLIKDKVEFTFNEGKIASRETSLFGAITKRRTYREEFANKKIPLEIVEKLNSVSNAGVKLVMISDKKQINLISQLVQKADKVWYKSKTLIHELEEWMRDDLELTKDGLPTGMINMYKIAAETKYIFSKDSRLASESAEKDRIIANNTPLFFALVSQNNDIESWITTGEMYGELTLTAQKLGLASGVLGSITELTGIKKEMAKSLDIKGHIQLVISVGYAKVKVPTTPRRSIDEMLI